MPEMCLLRVCVLCICSPLRVMCRRERSIEALARADGVVAHRKLVLVASILRGLAVRLCRFASVALLLRASRYLLKS